MPLSIRRFLSGALLAGALGPCLAQPACERAAGAPAWLPCGPERTLSADDLKAWLARPGETVKIAMTGGGSGRKFNLVLSPNGKLDMRVGNGADFGREWKLEGDKLCFRIYGGWKGEFNCGPVELKEGRVWWFDPDDKSRNPFDNVTFSK